MGGGRSQVNKAHKTRFASKASRHAHKIGTVSLPPRPSLAPLSAAPHLTGCICFRRQGQEREAREQPPRRRQRCPRRAHPAEQGGQFSIQHRAHLFFSFLGALYAAGQYTICTIALSSNSAG